MSWTTTDLLNAIKKRALIPSSQQTYTDSDLLQFANDELQMQIVPMLLSVREEYLVEKYSVSIVASTANYTIPTRAIGRKLRELDYVDSQGYVRLIPRLDHAEYPQVGFQLDVGDPQSYYLQADDIILDPTPSTTTSGTLRMFYFQRPNDLVSVNAVSTITAINTSTNVVTVNLIPSTFSVGTLCDFVMGTPGFRNRAIDQAITALGTNTITFASLPTGLAVGDYVCLAGQAPVVQMPTELFPVCAQRVVVKVLEGLGDAQGVQVAQAKLQEMEQRVLQLLSQRVEGSAKKIINQRSILSYFSRGF